MADLKQLYSDAGLCDIFDSIGVGVVLIDTQFQVKLVNLTAGKILGYTHGDSHQEAYCYTLFCREKSACTDCPLHASKLEPVQTKSYSLKKNNGDVVLIKVEFQRWNELAILTVADVTKEVTILKKIDLDRKEAEAKNILLERKVQKSQDEMATVKYLVDHLPDALVTVDQYFTIQRKNTAVDKVFSLPSAEKCHELLGYDLPCEHCPAERGFELSNDFKKSHAVGDRYYTEFFVNAPSAKGGVLLFTETTRRIRLIEEIRSQQNTLSGLVDLSAMMQKEGDAQLVLEFFLDKLLSELAVDSAALLVDEIRAGTVWLILQRGIDKDGMDRMTKSYLSREAQSSTSEGIPDDALPWAAVTQIFLVGGQGKKVGLIAFPGEYSDEMKKKISLYTESLGAYIHNRLLVKLLEEKANTDQLTGLYNRRFFEQILVEEQEKFKKYTINFALVIADINKLKYVNDTFGHEAGDKLITTVADTLNMSIRKADVVARMGGDEFSIMLADTSDSGAQQFIVRFQEEVFKNVKIPVGTDDHFPVTLSFGAAGSDCFSFDEMCKIADKRMYADKEEFYRTQKKYR